MSDEAKTTPEARDAWAAFTRVCAAHRVYRREVRALIRVERMLGVSMGALAVLTVQIVAGWFR